MPILQQKLRSSHTQSETEQIASKLPTNPCVLHKLGYLKGCPNLTARGGTKYLNLSPATAKGHMKWPRKDICSPCLCPLEPMTDVHDSPDDAAIAPIAKAGDDSALTFPITILAPCGNIMLKATLICTI
jgi:hypothetical protein